MRDVYVIGAYTTAFKKHPGVSFGDLAREAYLGTLADAAMKNGADIEAGWLGNCGMGFWGQNSIRAQALFQPLVEEGLFRECQINCVREFHGGLSSTDCSRQAVGKEDDELGVGGAPLDGRLPVNAEIPQRQIE